MSLVFDWVTLSGNVGTAFLHAPIGTSDHIYIRAPSEHYPGGNILWRLLKATYGLKTAPKAWQDFVASVLKDLEITRCKSDSNLYYHKSSRVHLLLYGEDVLIFGKREAAQHLFDELAKRVLFGGTGELNAGTLNKFIKRKWMKCCWKMFIG